jgi:hypothetical protein
MSDNSPLNVTDEQLATICRASDVLLPPDRPAFLAALENRLRGEVIGDGAIGRAIRELQWEYLRPTTGDKHAPKHEPRDLGPAIGTAGRGRSAATPK